MMSLSHDTGTLKYCMQPIFWIRWKWSINAFCVFICKPLLRFLYVYMYVCLCLSIIHLFTLIFLLPHPFPELPHPNLKCILSQFSDKGYSILTITFLILQLNKLRPSEAEWFTKGHKTGMKQFRQSGWSLWLQSLHLVKRQNNLMIVNFENLWGSLIEEMGQRDRKESGVTVSTGWLTRGPASLIHEREGGRRRSSGEGKQVVHPVWYTLSLKCLC